MSPPNVHSRPVIPPEMEAEMTPAVKAFVEGMVDHYESQCAEYNARIEEQERQIKKLTPQNSSVPPSTQHPHARPNKPAKDGKKRRRGGAARSQKTSARTDSHGTMR